MFLFQNGAKKECGGAYEVVQKVCETTETGCNPFFLAPFNMLSLVSLAGTRIPIYIASRCDPRYDAPNRWWRWVRDGIYHLADGISVQSERNKEYFSKLLRKKVSVIYNPVFIKSELIGRALETPKEPVIVSVGRLNKVKNQELLLDVFKRFTAIILIIGW